MGANSFTRIKRLLADASQGNEEAREAPIPVVYNLRVSPATVKRKWVTARAWLRHEWKRNEGR